MGGEVRGDFFERARGAFIGLAAGDALGTSVEFSPRGTFSPLTTIVGGGPFGLAPGQWTDDTSMALCLAASLCWKEGFDEEDQMRRYVAWWKQGYMSSTGVCFDIGNATRMALLNYLDHGDPVAGSTDPYRAGNGCLMRYAPVAIYVQHRPRAERLELARRSAITTHASPECVQATQIFQEVLWRALDGRPKEEVLTIDASVFGALSDKLQRVCEGEWRGKGRDEIRGSGYVVEALEAALWCVHRSATFEEAVLMAANLGDDADTTAAICGQIAGALHGEGGIPRAWREVVAMRETIEELCDGVAQLSARHGA